MLSLSKHGGQASAHALRQAQGDSPCFNSAYLLRIYTPYPIAQVIA